MKYDTLEAARDALNLRPVTDFYKLKPSPDRARDKYCCPICGSGFGPNGTGALHIWNDERSQKPRALCFAGQCFSERGQDTLGALQILWSHDEGRQLKEYEVLERAGYEVEINSQGIPAASNTDGKNNSKRHKNAVDYSKYYSVCQERLQDPEAIAFLNSRGISYLTAKHGGVGYDPAADPANAPGGVGTSLHPCKRIILPSTKSHYLGRSIDPKTPVRYRKLNVANQMPGIYNLAALNDRDNKIVVVTEGAFDALAVNEVGFPAIALNSINNKQLLLDAVEKLCFRGQKLPALILCLDNDVRGQKTTSELKKDLLKLNVRCVVCDYGKEKDPNEALISNREAFLQSLQQAEETSLVNADSTELYIRHQMFDDLVIQEKAGGRKTGFANLDELSRGLYPGLYILGAIPSLGKTTFALQIGDQMAAAGNHVLFFTLEQSRLELACKSLSRTTAKADFSNAIASVDISRRVNSPTLNKAIEDYLKTSAKTMYIIESDSHCDVEFIRQYVRNYIEHNGCIPVVIIDYLQILHLSSTQQH